MRNSDFGTVGVQVAGLHTGCAHTGCARVEAARVGGCMHGAVFDVFDRFSIFSTRICSGYS